MKKFWAATAFAVAILCIALNINSILWPVWPVPAGHRVLTWIAIVLGIPSGLLLFFYLLRFLIESAIPSASNVTFLTILWMGIISVVLICLYPPWVKTTRLPSSNIKATHPVGYALLWHPPEVSGRASIYSGIAIDYSRLVLQIFVVGLITGGLLYVSKDEQTNGKTGGLPVAFKGSQKRRRNSAVNWKRGFRRVTRVLAIILASFSGIIVGGLLVPNLAVLEATFASSRITVLVCSLCTGVSVAAFVYISIGLLYHLIEWLVLGFCAETGQVQQKDTNVNE